MNLTKAQHIAHLDAQRELLMKESEAACNAYSNALDLSGGDYWDPTVSGLYEEWMSLENTIEAFDINYEVL